LTFDRLDDAGLLSKRLQRAVERAWKGSPLRPIAAATTETRLKLLSDAAKTGPADLVRAALRGNLVGLDTDLHPPHRSTLIHNANLPVLKVLVHEFHDNVNKRSADGSTPLVYSCMSGGAPDVTRFLLENDADPYVVDSDGDSALWYANNLNDQHDGRAKVAALRQFGVKGSPRSPVHTSPGTFRDALPAHIRRQVASGLYWRPEWD